MTNLRIRANSLLYAIYVCLLVSIICTALLYYSNLYNLLNQHYNIKEDLYIQNQSALTFYLNSGNPDTILEDSETGVTSFSKKINYGLLEIDIISSIFKNDTISSAYFTGCYTNDKTALFLTNFSNQLSYSGLVKIIGSKKLPSKNISEKFTSNQVNSLKSIGNIDLSENNLPAINLEFKKFIDNTKGQIVQLKDVTRVNDSIYYNSFFNKTIEINIGLHKLQNIIIKGNFILHNKDSLTISSTAILEDVIIKSPIVKIEENVKGTFQVFSTKKIEVNNNVQLKYPSALIICNESDENSSLVIGESSSIYGAVVLFGSPINKIDQNEVVLKENTLIVGDVYCTGKFMPNGKIYGSIYTNRIFTNTKTATYQNCIMNTEIDITKRPGYYISFPIFNSNDKANGVFKRVF
ncbi:hypothetical protein [Flavobacterium capsici]|uniref:Polymer-forming cytoskeletal protein n=1 Tax=Flavobacterium capsici TaxID=3075618 RepID=A0AA96F163_9FLAO|nr:MULTISPECIES: hypothetical protein [unclassified Flavobacterium]WNM19466.1 hypothetical protein RN608_02005 [Flavobacterium sp. PMR2A8]WNM20855.1 hypothetical protein RN605_09175 [Flavobacterium sp. PMTSA4]